MAASALFQTFPHLGHKILYSLELQTIIHCSLVCKSWLRIIHTPSFWLAKLEQYGFPECILQEWRIILGADVHPPGYRIVSMTMRCQISFLMHNSLNVVQKSFILHCPVYLIAYRYGQTDILRSLIHKCQNPLEKSYLTVLYYDLQENEN